jgi:hypothetical protein
MRGAVPLLLHTSSWRGTWLSTGVTLLFNLTPVYEFHRLNREDVMCGARRTQGRGEKCIIILVRRPVGKRPLERPMRRWEDSIIMDIREIWWEGVD